MSYEPSMYVDAHARCAHRVYKMTCEEYDALAARANGSCQLCAGPIRRGLLDHDHSVGRWAIRGLVCSRCNSRLMMVDHGRWERTEDVDRYLRNAWHLTLRPNGAPEWVKAESRPREIRPARVDSHWS